MSKMDFNHPFAGKKNFKPLERLHHLLHITILYTKASILIYKG